jgi:hypothetical protein
MAPKMNAKKDQKVRKTISMQIRLETIEEHERGVECDLTQSTISTIIVQKYKFKAVSVKDTLARIFAGGEMIGN